MQNSSSAAANVIADLLHQGEEEFRMISQKRVLIFASIIILSLLLSSLLSGCCGLFPLPKPKPDLTQTPEVVVGPGHTEVPEIACPTEKTLYSLWFSHLAVLDIDAGDGETFYLKFENIPPSYFDLWIESDGTISNEGIFREAPIGYNGTANHPKDADCPVQTFDGTWQMRAKITGTCVNDVARIHIIEEWIDAELHSSCGDAIGPGPGLYSGPELDLIFDLNSDFPADGIQIPAGGLFHASYAYVLYPAGYELPIVPLVPEQ